MIKFVVAYVLILFDVVLGADNIQLDLLPDFIGYAILVYGIWKMQKIHAENTGFCKTAKQGLLLFSVSTVISYIACLLDLYGIVVNGGHYAVLAMSVVMDILGILAVYMFIRLLTDLQGLNPYFQVKRINTLLMVKVLCIACQYVAITFDISEFTMTFLVFDLFVNLILLVYMATSALTYKQKYNNA